MDVLIKFLNERNLRASLTAPRGNNSLWVGFDADSGFPEPTGNFRLANVQNWKVRKAYSSALSYHRKI